MIGKIYFDIQDALSLCKCSFWCTITDKTAVHESLIITTTSTNTKYLFSVSFTSPILIILTFFFHKGIIIFLVSHIKLGCHGILSYDLIQPKGYVFKSFQSSHEFQNFNCCKTRKKLLCCVYVETRTEDPETECVKLHFIKTLLTKSFRKL